MRTERLAAIGEMTSTIIHDLRGPITTVRGNAQLLAGMPLDPDEVVEIHGGRLTAESVEGQGTTFWVQLPVVPGALG